MSRIVRFSRWPLALLIALVAVGVSFGSAAAAPSSGGRDSGKREQVALSRRYKAAQQRVRVQGERLNRVMQHVAKLDALIAKLKAKGKDTTALEQAVAAFRASMDKVRGEWQAASDTLSAHAGFDANGNVTDATQARATLQTTQEHMAQAHTLARDAYKSLRTALAAYRKAHREVTAPVAPPQP